MLSFPMFPVSPGETSVPSVRESRKVLINFRPQQQLFVQAKGQRVRLNPLEFATIVRVSRTNGIGKKAVFVPHRAPIGEKIGRVWRKRPVNGAEVGVQNTLV